MVEPGPLPTRWLTVYTIWMAVGGALTIAWVWITPPRWGAPYLVGDIGAGALAVAVAIGLWWRQRWAWEVNYWGLLLVPLVLAGLCLALAVLAVLAVILTLAFGGAAFGLGFQEVLLLFLIALMLGLWPALNIRYFRRRRHLFSG